MSTQTLARPSFCGICGCAIWRQSAPYILRVDCQPLQSAAEELGHRLWGRWTYHAYKVGGSFELAPRHAVHLDGDYTRRPVLADHVCTNLPSLTHPDYWPTVAKGSNNDQPAF
jgi:hypothetical protein